MNRLTAAVRGLLEALRTGWRHLRQRLHQLTTSVQQHTHRAWSRHTERLDTDRSYRRTLSTAIAALVSTLLPHPAVAAAVAVWVAEQPPPRPTGRYADPDDEAPTWGGRLWDTY